MANGIVSSALTMGAIEVQDLKDFIIEQIFTKPELLKIHGIETGVKMKEQIIFASQFGKTGLKASTTSCARQSSSPASTLTEKYWEPVGIEDTLIHCNATLDKLFKAYFTKIKTYREVYEIEGSDLEIFFSILFLETMSQTIWRAAWFGDTGAVAATTSTAGVKVAADVPYYTYFDGIFKQIFTAVAASSIKRYTISALPVVDGTLKQYTIFNEMWKLADNRLKSMSGVSFMVTGSVFENYREWLSAASINFSLDYTVEGFAKLKWNGVDVINMSNVWDASIADFVDDTTDNDITLPNRAVLTVKENIPLGTLNKDDFDNIELFYDQVSRQNYMGYGFTLDAKVIEEDFIVVGY